MYKLKITLKSDLCAGSGFSYAGIIDNDSVFDDLGLPYIPARRIKGCLRESCDLVDISKEYEDIIFGISGHNNSESIVIDNAYLSYYEELRTNLKNVDYRYKNYLNAQNVLSKYSTTKAQTAIEDSGVAKDGTLRFIRTINHYDPIEKKEMSFYANILLDNLPKNVDKEKVYVYLNKLVKATRNIGLNRNRGLGSVKMELINVEEKTNLNNVKLSENACGFEYVIENKSPLILSDTDINSTINYIKGSNVLASLVKEYLKNGEVDEEFNDLFLSGKVIYSNAYKAELNGDNWYRSYPVPLNINRLKKTKKLVDLSYDDKDKNEAEEYKMTNGNQAKKIKNKNIIKYSDGYKVVETINEVVYHHSHSGINKKDEEGLLYYLDAVSKGQYFKGYVYGDVCHLNKILELFMNANLSFGKSKTAQYGNCQLVAGSIKEINKVNHHFAAGDVIQVKLLSDGIFINENGSYVTNYLEAKNIIAKELGIVMDDSDAMSFVKNNVVTGYLGVWNLQKSQVPAISSGSVFTYKLKEELNVDKAYVGERNIDGLGEVLIEKKHDSFRLPEHVFKENVKEKPNDKTKIILKEVIVKELYHKLVKEKQEKDRIKITASSLGRLTLMLIESANESSLPKEILGKLNERVKSIKTDNKRKEIDKYIRTILGFSIDDYMDFTKLVQGYDEYNLLIQMASKEEANKLISELCVPLLREMLAFEKYRKKGE